MSHLANNFWNTVSMTSCLTSLFTDYITDYRNAEAWISGDRSVVHPIPQCYMDHVSQHAFLPLLSSRERHYGAVTIRQDPDGRSDGYWKNECGISQAIVYLYISIVTCLMYDRSDEVIRCRHMSDGSRKVALPYLPVLVSCIPSRTFSELCHCMASMLALYRPEILQRTMPLHGEHACSLQARDPAAPCCRRASLPVSQDRSMSKLDLGWPALPGLISRQELA